MNEHAAARSIQLSLVAHTNVGKTTLARTLLQRDVGEVHDAPHVTEFADGYAMLRTPEGETLRLWDTPGFGDSVRLLRRMRQSANPLGWFLSQVWDRWRDRPFWASQQALRHVAETSDVVLYLVNAAEAPQAAAYVASEMALLEWVGRPVIVLLNQLGAPREAPDAAAELQRWRDHLAAFGRVRAVLPLDAFTRCWVQESVLLAAVERCLHGEPRACMERLHRAWRSERLAVFDAAVAELAGSVARLAAERVSVDDGGALRAGLRRVGSALGIGGERPDPLAEAQATLAAAAEAEVRASTTRLIALHGLAGQAGDEVIAQLAVHYRTQLRVDEGRAALLGGALTGALVGLKADIASGGLTLGGGLLAGGLLGAIGAAGVARVVNLARGTDRSWVGWNAQALGAALHAAVLRYLAVAHFGRGRGEWERDAAPPRWAALADEALAGEAAALDVAFAERGSGDAAPDAIAPLLRPSVERALRAVLARLYPDSPVPEPGDGASATGAAEAEAPAIPGPFAPSQGAPAAVPAMDAVRHTGYGDDP